MKPDYRDYHKVGLLAIRDGRILLCRKKHTTALLILPGGCFEPGESAAQCLNRELREELGDVQVDIAEYVGTYTDVAAGRVPKTYASNSIAATYRRSRASLGDQRVGMVRRGG